MSMTQSAVFKLLNKSHHKKSFDCGIEPLNQYLKQRAGQELRRHLAFPYVMTFEGENDIKGYYTLSSSAVSLADLPPDLAKLTRYPSVPLF